MFKCDDLQVTVSASPKWAWFQTELGVIVTLFGCEVRAQIPDDYKSDIQLDVLSKSGKRDNLAAKVEVAKKASSVDGTPIPRAFAVLLPETVKLDIEEVTEFDFVVHVPK